MGDFTGYLYHSKRTSAGVVQARGLVNNATNNGDGWAFRLQPNGSWTAKWIVGDHGVSGSRYFWIEAGKPVDMQPIADGFMVSTRIGNKGTLTFRSFSVIVLGTTGCASYADK